MNTAIPMKAETIISTMDEMFTEKILISIIATAEQTTMIIGIGFFFILISIFTAASTISIPTAILIPLNAFATHVISRNLSKNFDIKKIMLDKIRRNAQKYPVEKAKGSAKKYNEL